MLEIFREYVTWGGVVPYVLGNFYIAYLEAELYLFSA